MVPLQSFLSIICCYVLLSQQTDSQDITPLITTFGEQLESLMCDGLRIGGDKCSNGLYGVQDFIYSFDQHFEDDVSDASDLAQSIIDRLDKKINERALFLRNLSSIIRSECINHIGGSESESLTDFNDLYFSGNDDKAPYLPNDMAYSTVYENTVTLSTPTFKIPNGVDITNENVIRDARISQLLDSTMLNLHQEYCVDPDGDDGYCSMYFGTINGVFRQFPGVENPFIDGSYADYDPRFRPWYVSAATGSKDVVILLDISGSMRANDRIVLAKEAVVSVLTTLGSSSFVNVVAFSDTLTLSCFQRILVPATSRNVAELIDFVNNLTPQGLTNFTIAFDAAFDILKTATNCQTSILFLTDGIADDVSALIEERNTVDIGAVIFSYTLGDEAETAVPLKVAELTNGIYTHIDDKDENLITAMSSYYLYYAYGGGSGDNINDDIILTSPYFDFDTDVVMITMAVPVYLNDTYFVGVVGTDIPLTFLSEAIGDITIGRKSYSFVMNEESELILHPLIPSNSDYKSTFVNDVEPQEFNATVLPKMLKRESGSMRIEASVKQSAGNVIYNGYIHEDAELLYIYSGVGPSSLSIAIVIYSESDLNAPFVPSFGMKRSPSVDCNGDLDYVRNSTDLEECLAPFNIFHRFDLMETCNSDWLSTANILDGSDAANSGKPGNAFYEGKLYTTDYPIYLLQNGLFEEQYDALDVDPTCDELNELHTLTNRLGTIDVDLLPFGGFREEISQNVLNSIYTLSSLHEFWRPTFLSNDSLFVSMWFGHYQGLHISYPGKQFSNSYNNQIRPWYQRAISYPQLMVWTTPYLHATTQKLVTGGSTVIYAPFSEYAFGVIGFSYEYQQFVDYWKSSMNSICDENIKTQHCYLVDSSAFCLYYEGMEEDVDDDDISTKFFGDLEPTLMQSLLDRGFFVNDTNVNYNDDSIDITYIIDQETYANNGDFESVPTDFVDNSGKYTVHSVAKTNLFVIYISGYHNTNVFGRDCPENDACSGVVSPGCLTTKSGTECISATTDVCISPDSTMTASSSSSGSCSVISDLGICVLQNDDNSDMCASNFIGNECDVGTKGDDKDKSKSTMIIVVCVVVLVSLCLIIMIIICHKRKEKPSYNNEGNTVQVAKPSAPYNPEYFPPYK